MMAFEMDSRLCQNTLQQAGFRACRKQRKIVKENPQDKLGG